MKNILITGTSSGFGKEIAELLSTKGYNVVGTSRNPSLIESKYPILRLDVNEDYAAENVLKQFIETHAKIDVLINNAGFGIAGPIEETSIDEAKAQFETNFFGIVRMIKATLPFMRSQKGGLIINMGSIGGQIGLPFQGYYSASKFALEGFTEALRIEVRPFNINILNVNPGDFSTKFTANRQITKFLTNEYQPRFEKALKIYEKDEKRGSNPLEVALLIEKLILKGESYKVRYFVGSAIQKLAVGIKKYIGSQTFENIMIKNYKQN